MDISKYLENLDSKFPTFTDLKSHIEHELKTRQQIKADYSRLPDQYREAGVVCTLILPQTVIDNQLNPLPYLHIIYEKRSNNMKSHPGQMAFPGGTYEEQDNDSIIRTAFREAQEEVGIDPSDLEFIAMMDEFIASSNILVHPVICWMIEDLPIQDFQQRLTVKYQPKTDESVATVVMPISHLLNPEYYTSRPYKRNGKQVGFARYFFTTEIRPDDNIWGLTASMTRRFFDIVFPDNLLPDEVL